MKTENKFKCLYQLNRMRKVLGYNSMDFKHLQQPPVMEFNDDSLEITSKKQTNNNLINQLKKKEGIKSNHNRSQSCPYTLPNALQKNSQLKQFNGNPYATLQNSMVQNKILEQSEATSSKLIEIKKINRLNKNLLPFSKKSSAMKRSSQLSQSNKSVVIHNNALNSFQLSSMLYSQKKMPNQQMKKGCITKISKRNMQNGFQDRQILKQKYLKIKLEQRMKKYQLNQDLKKIQKQSSDIAIKHSILQNILRKSQSDNQYLGYETNQSYVLQDQI